MVPRQGEVRTSYAHVSTRSVSLLVPSCSRPQVLPALTERTDRLIPEDPHPRRPIDRLRGGPDAAAALVGMLREARREPASHGEPAV